MTTKREMSSMAMNGIALHGNNLFNGLPVAQSLTGFLRGFFMDEIWKPIPNMDYSASSNGDIRNDLTGNLVSFCLDNKGYKICCLKNNKKWKSFRSHRLIALAFLGDSKGLFVDHIDADKSNNNISNLRYVTHRENCIYSTKRKNEFTGTLYDARNGRKKPWQALVSINNKNKSLGNYSTQIEAHNAYLNYIQNNLSGEREQK